MPINLQITISSQHFSIKLCYVPSSNQKYLFTYDSNFSIEYQLIEKINMLLIIPVIQLIYDFTRYLAS